MLQMPLVSVIIPVFNGEKYIKQTLESVINQTYKNLEIIVVDDGSIDATADIVKSFSNIKYIYQENTGPARARNVGVENSSGEYLAFLDQDDQWVPEKINTQMQAFAENEKLDYTIAYQQILLKDNCKKPHWLKAEFLEQPVLGFLPGTLLVKRSAFFNIGAFTEKYVNASDADWFYKAADFGLILEIIPKTLLLRFIHDSNHSNKINNLHYDLVRLIKASINRKREKDLYAASIIN